MTSSDKLKRLFSRKNPAKAKKVKDASASVLVSKPVEKTPRIIPVVADQSPVVVLPPEPGAKPAPKPLEVLETYPLNEPFAYAKILKNPARGSVTFFVDEPKLDAAETASLDRLTTLLGEILELKPTELKSKKAAKKYLLKKCDEILAHYNFKVTPETKNKILYYIVRNNLGLGKIDALMHDPLIEDISCDGNNVPVYIWHRKYESVPTNIRFETADELDEYALRLAYLCGSHVSIAQPMMDASLPDGSRLNLTYGSEITRRGSTFTIRKFKLDPFTITDMVAFNTVSTEMAAYFWYAVENRVSILVGGGIAAGKTTMLNCMSMFIKPDLKVVSIEDTPELNLPHENWIPAATRAKFGMGKESADITLFDLLKASLRQRPDYIIVGEIRGAEAYTLFQAVSTGHLGMSTIHAESVESAVYRLESAPMNIPRTLIAGVDIILIQKKVEYSGKPVRRTVATAEIVGLDPRSGEILTNEVYKWNPSSDAFDFTGRSYIIERIAEKKGITIDEAYEEIQRRTQILDAMQKRGVRNYKAVSDIIRGYYANPEEVLREALEYE